MNSPVPMKPVLLRICVLCLFLGFYTPVSGQGAVTQDLLKAYRQCTGDSCRILALQQLVNDQSNDNWLQHNDTLLQIALAALRKKDVPGIQKVFYLNAVSFYFNSKAFEYIEKDEIDHAAACHKRSLAIARITGNPSEMATALNGLGYLKQYQGEGDSAIWFYEKSVQFHKLAGNTSDMVTPYANMASIYGAKGDVKKALAMNFEVLHIHERDSNKYGIAFSLMNIAQIYQREGELERAEEDYREAYRLRKEIGDEHGMATSLQNIGRVFQLKKKFREADSVARMALHIQLKNNFKKGIGSSLHFIGVNFSHQGFYDSALFYQQKALKALDGLKEKQQMAYVYDDMAVALHKLDRNKEARQFALLGLQTARELGFPENIRNSAETLYGIYKAEKNFKGAVEMYTLFVSMRDSLNNAETGKAAIRTRLKYEYEKKATADSVRVTGEQQVVQTRLKSEKTQRYALYAGLGLVFIFALFMLNRFQVASKQKKIIQEQKTLAEAQKHLVEEKQKEILDSIYYARRIQRTLITNEKYIEKRLRNLNGKLN